MQYCVHLTVSSDYRRFVSKSHRAATLCYACHPEWFCGTGVYAGEPEEYLTFIKGSFGTWLTPIIVLVAAILEKGTALAILDSLEKIITSSIDESPQPVGTTAFLSALLALTGAIRYRLSVKRYYYAPPMPRGNHLPLLVLRLRPLEHRGAY